MCIDVICVFTFVCLHLCVGVAFQLLLGRGCVGVICVLWGVYMESFCSDLCRCVLYRGIGLYVLRLCVGCHVVLFRRVYV